MIVLCRIATGNERISEFVKMCVYYGYMGGM